jgi:cytochrome c
MNHPPVSNVTIDHNPAERMRSGRISFLRLQSLCRLLLPVLCVVLPAPVPAVEAVDPKRFEKEVLVPAARDAIQMEVLANGDVVFAEFWGMVKRWDAKTGGVSVLGTVQTFAKGEIGLLGMAVAR